MDERRRLGVEIVLGGCRAANATRYVEAGAYVLVLCTALSRYWRRAGGDDRKA